MQFFQEFRFNFFTAGLQDLGAGTETARLTRSLTNTLPKLRSLQFVESSSESLTKIKVEKKKKTATYESLSSLYLFYAFVFQGTLATGVPGEVRGYHTAWRAYGRLPWKQLVQPAIDQAKYGFLIYPSLYLTILKKEHDIRKDPGLR